MTYLNLKSNKFPGAKSFEDYFSDFLQPNPSYFKEGRNFPAVNVIETKENYSLEFSAPGRKKEDFNIHIEGNLLEVSSEQKQEVNEETENYTRREFKLTSFKRTFTLPETINVESISAEYTDGILKLTLPKKEEAKKEGPKKITIS
ncbi:heat-shock protein [Bacteroidota bacterium]|nr:heat-shock protein [Bacteroidota bacterium]